MTIYCPYWIINLSTRTIALKVKFPSYLAISCCPKVSHLTFLSNMFYKEAFCSIKNVLFTRSYSSLQEDDKEAPFVQQGTDESIMLFYFRDKPLFGSNKRKVGCVPFVSLTSLNLVYFDFFLALDS